MGQHHSRVVEKRLSTCLPPAACDEVDTDFLDNHGWRVFPSEEARSHFIKALLILLSANGARPLQKSTFETFYHRSFSRTEDRVWYTCAVVSMENYQLRHAVVAAQPATTKAGAFRLLMVEVEARMGELLWESAGGGSRCVSGAGWGQSGSGGTGESTRVGSYGSEVGVEGGHFVEKGRVESCGPVVGGDQGAWRVQSEEVRKLEEGDDEVEEICSAYRKEEDEDELADLRKASWCPNPEANRAVKYLARSFSTRL